MIRKTLPIWLLICLFAFSAFAQNRTENLIENTNLHFLLDGEPTLQAVGFDNPKNSWKVKYQLYLTDFSELEKLGLMKINEGYKYINPLVDDTSFNKKIKKNSLKITKGKFTKKSLFNDANRDVLIPVKLSPEAVQIFDEAVKIPEKNPSFVLIATVKVSVKNSAKQKLKDKYSLTQAKSLKFSKLNEDLKYDDVKTLRLSSGVVKRENGQLILRGGLIH